MPRQAGTCTICKNSSVMTSRCLPAAQSRRSRSSYHPNTSPQPNSSNPHGTKRYFSASSQSSSVKRVSKTPSLIGKRSGSAARYTSLLSQTASYSILTHQPLLNVWSFHPPPTRGVNPRSSRAPRITKRRCWGSLVLGLWRTSGCFVVEVEIIECDDGGVGRRTT